MSVPSELTGVWRREVITTPAGFRDETTTVLWLQTDTWYADIRVKADRPIHPGATSFADYSNAELLALAATQGFAGELTAHDGVCLWRRDLDYQPPSSEPDEATFAIDGEVMIEDGIHSAYQEIWRREPGSTGLLQAWRRENGLRVRAGAFFMEILDRDLPLPPGASLGAIVEAALAAGDRSTAIDALAMRISFGTIETDGAWRVTLSTWPWTEGQTLPAGDWTPV